MTMTETMMTERSDNGHHPTHLCELLGASLVLALDEEILAKGKIFYLLAKSCKMLVQ